MVFVVVDKMAASPDLVLALVLCLLIRLAGKIHSFHNHPILAGFFRVDPLYLGSLVDVLTTPADRVLAFVLETVLSQCRWPLHFAELPSTLPLPWSVWTSVYRRARERRGPALKVLASGALVLSRRCLQHLGTLQFATVSAAMPHHTSSTPTDRERVCGGVFTKLAKETLGETPASASENPGSLVTP